MARFASSARARASSEFDFACSSSAISASFSARNSEHGGDGGVGAAHQPDEIDVDADRHGRHGPIDRDYRGARSGRRSAGRHRQGAGVDDRHHWRREQHAHRDDDEKRGKDEGVCCLAGAAGADKGDRRPRRGRRGTRRPSILVRHASGPASSRGGPEELPAEADQEALGEEYRGEPEQQLRRRRPEHRTDRDDDGKERRGDRRRQLVLGEEEKELIIERRSGRWPSRGPLRAAEGCSVAFTAAEAAARASAKTPAVMPVEPGNATKSGKRRPTAGAEACSTP